MFRTCSNHCDVIPVRAVSTSYIGSDAIQTTGYPFSPEYLSMREKLTQTHAQSALNSIVGAPNLRDGTSVITLAKWLTNAKESVNEHAALVRCMCMLMSLDNEMYITDPCKYQFLRRSRSAYQDFKRKSVLSELHRTPVNSRLAD